MKGENGILLSFGSTNQKWLFCFLVLILSRVLDSFLWVWEGVIFVSEIDLWQKPGVYV